MFMRRRPLLRAAAIGGSAYVAGKRAGQRQADQQEAAATPDQGSGTQYGQYGQGDQQAPAQGVPGDAAASIPDQLNRLSALHDQGALTDAEFASAKAKLLGT
jgi:hypothetical protein